MCKLLNDPLARLAVNSNTRHIQYEISHMVLKKKKRHVFSAPFGVSKILFHIVFLFNYLQFFSLNLANSMAYTGSAVEKPFRPM